MNKKYILINSFSGGGAERQVSMIAPGCEIEQIILLEDDKKYDLDFNFVSLGKKLNFSALLKTALIPWYLIKLYLLRSFSGDVILSFLVRANLINILFKLVSNHKAYISERNTPSQLYHSGFKQIYGILIKVVYPYADKITVNSYGIKKDLIENFYIDSSKIEVINNAVDVEKISLLSNEELSEQEKIIFQNKTIVNVGSLTDQKNQDFLIDLVDELREYKLIIVGEGSLRESLIEHAQTKGLKVFAYGNEQELNDSYDIYLVGFSSNPFKYLKNATLFALSSLWEGFPNVLLEAMASGSMIVSSDCKSGPREMLLGEICSGVLLPLATSDHLGAWISSINNLDEKSINQYRESALLKVKEYSIPIILKKWNMILNNGEA
ncbi:MAG: hypothetical protein CMK92_06790 [Pseudomonas sp.]|nr:hypothetical protein [Pseudomonas sp.]|tara:strand:+ start:178 stop:1317 length:1140 start_codon:yes stop_codon:yes gene_type:complete